jgi:hypothetical protein
VANVAASALGLNNRFNLFMISPYMLRVVSIIGTPSRMLRIASG